jgi:hypothetical protein
MNIEPFDDSMVRACAQVPHNPGVTLAASASTSR